ncbi:MAG: hypothetical protein JOY62_17205 [Acidobacteriaceae bacterium]|nr:hypothetical protein [Acidobacteriaceae bacterium]MBV9781703.1 hypothetical protein [Acidobacteriaceae bacterium]
MTEQNNRELRSLLKNAIPPVDPALPRDLWPDMVRKLKAPRSAVPLRRLPWYDWALIASSASVLALFPKFILLFVFHL